MQVDDQGGREERFYGKLGEVVKEIKTIASDTQGNSANSPEVWTTECLCDTFGRLQRLVYPDGEVLSCAYASNATFPPAAVVLMVTVCSAQNRAR